MNEDKTQNVISELLNRKLIEEVKKENSGGDFFKLTKRFYRHLRKNIKHNPPKDMDSINEEYYTEVISLTIIDTGLITENALIDAIIVIKLLMEKAKAKPTFK